MKARNSALSLELSKWNVGRGEKALDISWLQDNQTPPVQLWKNLSGALCVSTKVFGTEINISVIVKVLVELSLEVS